MTPTKKKIILVLIVSSVLLGTPFGIYYGFFYSPSSEGEDSLENDQIIHHDFIYPNLIGNRSDFSLNLTHIHHAGVMLETTSLRIYFDPYEIDEQNINYSKYPADLIFISHNHPDHYDRESIDMILKENTEIICPESCSDIITEYNATGVKIGCNITRFDFVVQIVEAYNFNDFDHRQSDGFCGYMLEIMNHSIFFAGVSDCIPEYSEINQTIDLAYLCIANNAYSLTYEEAKDVIGVLQPKMISPIHTYGRNITSFVESCQEEYPSTDIITFSPLYLV